MKVQTEELPNSEVALSFEIEDSRLQRAMDVAAHRLAGRVNIAGFRRGKAPRALVERVLGREAITEEALDDLLPEAYREALGETGVVALTEPQFDVESVSPFKAKATVVVPPPVELGDYRSIQHDQPDGSVSDAQVDESIQLMRERNANWVPAERPASMDDMVVVNVLGKVKEEVVIDEVDVDYLMIPQRTVPVPGFAEALVGLEPDEERAFDLAVPEDYDNQKLAGKTVSFLVRAKEVRVKELPELDDYFASTVGDYSTLADLRSHVYSHLSEQSQARAQEQVEQEIVESAVSASTVSLPDRLLDYEAQRARDRFVRSLESYGMNPQQYNRLIGKSDEDAEQSLRTQAEKSLRRELVLQSIAAKEGLVVVDEEVEERIAAAAIADGVDAKTAARLRQDSAVRQRVRASLLEEKGAEWLVNHVLRDAPATPLREAKKR